MIALAVLGFLQVTYYTTTNTILQLLVPPRLRGRVIALYILTSTGFIPVGNILAGVLGGKDRRCGDAGRHGLDHAARVRTRGAHGFPS